MHVQLIDFNLLTKDKCHEIPTRLWFVTMSIFGDSLYIGHTIWQSREKSMAISFFIKFLDSLGQDEYLAKKRKIFKVQFLHVLTCCTSVLVLKNFEKLQHLIFPTQLNIFSCSITWPSPSQLVPLKPQLLFSHAPLSHNYTCNEKSMSSGIWGQQHKSSKIL